MTHEFIELNGKNYIVCQDCRTPVGLDPRTREWAAYEAPALRVDDGTPNGSLVQRWDYALCLECYNKAYLDRYPDATLPDTLWDGRVPDVPPVKKE